MPCLKPLGSKQLGPQKPRYDPDGGKLLVRLLEKDLSTFVELHPDTLPDAIASRQRLEVAICRHLYGNDVEAISEVCVLCQWVVRRRLAELDGKPLPPPVATKRSSPPDYLLPGQVVKFLRGLKRPATAHEIAAAVGKPEMNVRYMMRRRHKVFKKCGKIRGKYKSRVYLWALKEKPT